MEYKEKIERIIEAGNLAPSGGNSQPWKFLVNGNDITIELVPERDNAVLNYKNRGTYIALGGLLENFLIASRREGLKMLVDEISVEGIRSVTVHFSELNGQPEGDNGLYEEIFKRHSNRTVFERDVLSRDVKDFLFGGSKDFSTCEVALVEGVERMTSVARELCLDTSISMQNEIIHRHLFQEILWRSDDQKKKPGIFVRTLEMSFPKALVFRLLSNWNIANFLVRHVKILDKIRSANISVGSSGALVGIIATENTDKGFVEVGRLMQNIWLKSSKQGLNLQVMAGMLFLSQRALFESELSYLSPKERQILLEAYARLMRLFGLGQKKIGAIAFRVGKGRTALAVSQKRPPEIYWS